MRLEVFKFPACLHLHESPHGGVCVRASVEIGVQVDVTAPVCNVTCRNHGGPYAGREPTAADWRDHLGFAHRPSVQKVAREYGPAGRGVRVIVPAIAPTLRVVFGHFLLFPWVAGFGLTGSAIVDGAKVNDLDVVLLVKDFRAYLNARPFYYPPAINGRRVDLFVKPVPLAGPFPVLNLQTNDLYAPPGFRIIDKDPVIDSGVPAPNPGGLTLSADAAVASPAAGAVVPGPFPKSSSGCGGCRGAK